MRRGAIAIWLGALATVLAVGCGGGGESKPETKAAFVEQGNSICKEAAEERKDAMEDADDGAELAGFVTEAVLPSIQGMTEELDDLGAPKGQEKQVAAIVDGFEGGVEQLEADPSGAIADNPFTVANQRAEAYGLTACRI